MTAHAPVPTPTPTGETPLRRLAAPAVAAVLSLGMVAIGVAPQLAARVGGEEIVLRVAPVDPVDPFRGAYVDLDYPALRSPGGSVPASVDDGRRGEVYAVLRPAADDPGTWELERWSRTRPEGTTYLACDDTDWRVRCGIESWFVPQDEAARLERALATTGALATIRVDDRGRAAIVDLRAP